MNAQEFGALPADGNPDALLSQEGIPLKPIKMTLEEFLESNLEACEYIGGELVPILPNSLEHGGIRTNLFFPLGSYVRENQLGRVYAPFTGFRVGSHILVPDVAFVSTDKLPTDRSGIFPIPPDLAVEIVSPTDVLYRVEEKAFTYLEAGTQLVWVLKPRSKTVTIYRSDTDLTLLTRNDTLTGEEVVKGFSCQVAELFE